MKDCASGYADRENGTVQKRIEAVMNRFVREDRWQIILLFSPDGLIMARAGASPDYTEDSLLEFSFSLLQAVELLGETDNVKDVILRSRSGTRLIFRYFPVGRARYILSLAASGSRGYRRALNRVVKTIQKEL